MNKAYDRVEWNYLWRVMEMMGFKPALVYLIMKCVSNASFSILINGNPTGHMVPSRGLRQGDPHSPYLFLLCAEGLVNLLSMSNRDHQLSDIRICRGAPSINHLIFVDNSVVFYKEEVEETKKLHQLFQSYEKDLGQYINAEKTAMVFSSNTPTRIWNELMAMWSNGMLQQYEKYLGFPTMIGHAKRKAFVEINDRIWQKLQIWKEKILSQGGKKFYLWRCLINTNYAMSCFKAL